MCANWPMWAREQAQSRREARGSEHLLYTWHAGGVYVHGTLVSQGDSKLSSHLSIFHSSAALYRMQGVCVCVGGVCLQGLKKEDPRLI